MKIIPAIDIINGKCVRLEQGDFSKQKSYETDPLEYAKQLEGQGFQYLHLVDLDGARKGEIMNLDILEKICNNTTLKVDFGGGIKTRETVKSVLNAGAQQFTAGSIAVLHAETVLEWAEEFGPERIILGADVKDETIHINGWKTDTGISLYYFLEKFVVHGLQSVICTDISKDGLLQGSSVELYRDILEEFPDLKLIASGGVHSLENIRELKAEGLYGAIVGKALLENKINLKELFADAD
ncbi:MAG: 1-(5-phosphoribosyl)-5-[(5-phosphoribosylamino)methylideneamino]imidazole-4-carboxamide isomerase [Bacteroidales bacterium]|nr:1-(5-phosphoribosyl)-5-[(5-phosphoribosylamino)methylideneamino]imidazole-4-carboxamide isomerase [Bacteroidales bacterium]